MKKGAGVYLLNWGSLNGVSGVLIYKYLFFRGKAWHAAGYKTLYIALKIWQKWGNYGTVSLEMAT